MSSIIGYKTPTCTTCKVAERVASASGVTIEWVDLSTNPGILAEVKRREGKEPHQMIQTPLFENPNSEKLGTIADLRTILDATAVA